MSDRRSKKLILDINAVKSVHVESCYKIFMSAYKKSNNNDAMKISYKVPSIDASDTAYPKQLTVLVV